MKITTYQPAVNPTVANTPAIQVPSNIDAFGSKGDGYNDLNAGIGQVNKVLAQKRDDEDAADVIAARNQIMTSMTEQLYGENGLITTGVGSNAKGLTDRVTDAIKKTVDDVAGQQNQRVAYALRQNISENMNNFQRVAAGKEMDEKQAYDKSQYDSSIANNSQLAALNYDKPEFVEGQVKQDMILLNARGKSQGWDGETLEANRIGMTTNLVSNVVMAAIDNKDYDTANTMLTKYRSGMEQGTYNKLNSAVQEKQEVKEMDLKVRDILPQVTKPDGSIDFEKAHQLIDDINGPNATRTIKNKGTLSSGDQTIDGYISTYASQYGIPENIFSTLVKHESGYNQSAVSSAGAIGLTQLMPGTAQGLGVDPNDAEQNVMGGAMYLKQMYDATGNWRDALIAYNEGLGAFQEGHKYTESTNYADGILNDSNNAQETDKTVSAYDPEANQKMKSLFDAYAKDQLAAKAQREKDYIESVSKAMQNAGSYSGAVSYLESLGDSIDMDTKNHLKASAATYYGVVASTGEARGSRGGRGRSYNPANDQKTLEINSLKLQDGKNLTEEEIVNGNHASARLIANGYGSGGADLSNGKVMSSITDMLDNGASKFDIYNALTAAGASEETANYYVNLIDDSYD